MVKLTNSVLKIMIQLIKYKLHRLFSDEDISEISLTICEINSKGLKVLTYYKESNCRIQDMQKEVRFNKVVGSA